MAYTESNMFPLQTQAPSFALPEPATGKVRRLEDLASSVATVIVFWCNHCPYVLHIEPELLSLAREYMKKGVSFIAINSNDVANYPEDAPDLMAERVEQFHYPFPYLFDETQAVAKAYDAACTPDFYIFGKDMRLVYRGQFDPSRPKRNPIPSTGEDLRAALDAILAGNAVPSPQRPSGGCNIKWKN